MTRSQTTLPAFKTICSVVAVVYIALGGSMVVRGAAAAMREFGIPHAVLSSPHFADFFQFVFVHMMVIGLMIGMLGRLVEGGKRQQLVARILCAVQAIYTFLDVRTSDSFLGNGLYRGSGSLGPVIVDVMVLSCFAYLSIRPLRVHAEAISSARVSATASADKRNVPR